MSSYTLDSKAVPSTFILNKTVELKSVYSGLLQCLKDCCGIGFSRSPKQQKYHQEMVWGWWYKGQEEVGFSSPAQACWPQVAWDECAQTPCLALGGEGQQGGLDKSFRGR